MIVECYQVGTARPAFGIFSQKRKMVQDARAFCCHERYLGMAPDTLGRKPNAPKLGGKIMLWPRKYVTMVFCGVLKSGLAIQSTHFCVDLLSSERVHCIGKTEKAACCALADWFPRVGHGADKAQSDRCSQPLQQWRDAPERLSSWGIPTGVEATATCTTIVRFSDETTLLSAFLLGMWS